MVGRLVHTGLGSSSLAAHVVEDDEEEEEEVSKSGLVVH